MTKTPSTTRSQRPKALTVFTAAFVAGAVAAVGINRALDVHLAQAKPQVECEPIFVALRDLAQGSPVTIWDVALRDWPKAMLPTTALRADDRFEGMLVKHPVREGQPLLSVQLMAAEARAVPSDSIEQVAETYAPRAFQPAPASQPDADLWAAPNDPAPQTVVNSKPVLAPHQDVAVSGPIVTEAAVAGSDESTPLASLSAETTAPPAEAAIPEPMVATPRVDEVVTTADIPPLVTGDQLAPAAGVDQSAASTPAQPETPAAPGETVQAETPTQPESTPPQPVAAASKRYLVVPERIAVQAEASFTAPALQEPPTERPARATAQNQTQASPTEVVQQEQAPVKKKPTTTQGSTARSNPVPRVAQAPTLETHPNTEPQQPVTALDGLFPNLRATFGAVDEEMQKIRRERAAQERNAQERQQATAAQGRQQPSQQQKQQQQQPHQNNQPSRSARWPWSFGR